MGGLAAGTAHRTTPRTPSPAEGDTQRGAREVRELSDEIEREVKLTLPANEAAVLAHVRRLMPAGWRIHRTTQLDLDLYFDAAGLPLYRAGAGFRIRAQRSKGGWKANFKPPHPGGPGWLERREVRTVVTPDEALLFRTQGMPGLAATMAAEAAGGALVPIVHLVSLRRCYTVRPGEALGDWTNFVDVFFDEVTAFDLRGAGETAVAHLVEHRFLDCTEPPPTTAFGVLELEANGRGTLQMEERALETVLRLADALAGEGVAPVAESKYAMAVARLGLAEAGDARARA